MIFVFNVHLFRNERKKKGKEKMANPIIYGFSFSSSAAETKLVDEAYEDNPIRKN